MSTEAEKEAAPYCKHVMGGGGHCYRRTWHESGYCPQHRSASRAPRPTEDDRFGHALAEIRAEATRSIEKHGEQGHLPMGTGPETLPLAVMPHIGDMRPHVSAESLAVRATLDTKAHSQNEGGDGTVTWWHILREEVFEAAAEDDPAALRAELVQVAAVALKMIDALDSAVAAHDPGGDSLRRGGRLGRHARGDSGLRRGVRNERNRR